MKVKDVDALMEQISEDPREAFTKHQVWLFASIHNKTVPTIEAIPKTDVVAILEEIKDEANKLRTQKARENVFGREFKIEDYDNIIQSKIDELKGE